jgi:hypothetical protein
MVPEIDAAGSRSIRAGVCERVSKSASARDRKEIQKARSIEEQNKANLEQCEWNGWTIADRYPDPGLPALRFATKDRPEYKAAPTGALAPPGRDGSAGLPLPLPPGLWRRPAGAKGKTRGRGNPGKSRSRGGFDTGTPSRRLHRAYTGDLEGRPVAGAYSRRPVSNPPLGLHESAAFAAPLL